MIAIASATSYYITLDWNSGMNNTELMHAHAHYDKNHDKLVASLTRHKLTSIHTHSRC